jgi:hypothetical protein
MKISSKSALLRRIAARSSAIVFAIIAVLFALASCDNPINILNEIEIEYKRDNNLFLVIEDVAPSANSVGVNPGGEIRIGFDRPIVESSANASTIIIEDSFGNLQDWKLVDYNALTNVLKIKGDPYLEMIREYTIRIDGVRAADGSLMEKMVAWTFITGVAPAGSITGIVSLGSLSGAGNSPSQPGYTDVLDVEVSVLANDQAGYFLISDDADYMSDSGGFASSLEWQPLDIYGAGSIVLDSSDFADTGDGTKTLYVRFRHNSESSYSERASETIVYDTAKPTVNLAASRLVRRTAADYVASVSDGSGIQSYLWSGNGLLFDGAATDDSLSTSIAGLSDAQAHNGTFTVNFKAVDNAGNWNSDVMTFVWDTVAPSIGTVSIDGGAQYSLDTTLSVVASTFNDLISTDSQMDIVFSSSAIIPKYGWADVSADSYATTVSVSGGDDVRRYVYVWLRDEAGNTAGPYSDDIYVDNVAPAAPSISGSASDYSSPLSWSWTGGGGGNGTFDPLVEKYGTDFNPAASTATSYSPSVSTTGEYRLRVQERDDAGNWSAYSYYSTDFFNVGDHTLDSKAVSTSHLSPQIISTTTPKAVWPVFYRYSGTPVTHYRVYLLRETAKYVYTSMGSYVVDTTIFLVPSGVLSSAYDYGWYYEPGTETRGIFTPIGRSPTFYFEY